MLSRCSVGKSGDVSCAGREVNGNEEGALRLLSRAFRRMGSCQDLQVLNVKCKVNQENPTTSLCGSGPRSDQSTDKPRCT
jgi:hypothetical protein